jgi:pimeloyl-ACP methyl ester carboxylesterase
VSGPTRRLLTLAFAACVAASCGLAFGAASLKSEMRNPWQRTTSYVRTWLICGEFPADLSKGASPGSSVPAANLATDYLGEHGGEAGIRPTAGMTHTRPDGTTATWTAYTSPGDTLDFVKAFAGRPSADVVAYAYTTITRDRAGPVLLAIGSDDGVRVWVNGKLVHDNPVRRGLRLDSDIVEAPMRAGANAVLVKVEQGTGDWGLSLREIGDGEARLVARSSFAPALEQAAEGKLAVRTDAMLARFDDDHSPVRVEVVAPGGSVVGSQVAARGETVTFDTDSWVDGPYEVVCQMAPGVARRRPAEATSPPPCGLPANELTAYLPWSKGDAYAAAERLVESAKQADQSTQAGMVHAMLADLVRDRLGADLSRKSPSDLAAIHGTLMEFAELGGHGVGRPPTAGGSSVASQAAGLLRSPRWAVRARGMVRLAYRDEIDDSPQFCRAYLPAGYDPAKRWPMIVNLHGYNAENPPYVRWWSVDQRHDEWADRFGVIVIYPMGRYNTGYRGIGDADVVRCIELAKEQFSVDEDRVYLTGYSMGGGGTWHVGTRHPDLFAAIGPYYGGWDYHTGMDEAALQRLTPRERFQMERDSSFAQAEQLLTLPIWVLHGDADPLVNPDESRYAVRMLERWGYDIRYREVPGGVHGPIGGEEDLYRWFLSHRRDPYPKQVRVRSGDLKGASAYWVTVIQQEKPFAFIEVEAEVLSPNSIRLDTLNVLEVHLTPGPLIRQPVDRALAVIWNGELRRVPPDEHGAIVLRARGYRPGKLVKRPALAGPISDVYNTPFAVVQGTVSRDAMMRRLCGQQAETSLREWEAWQHWRPRFFLDREMKDVDVAKYSLILIGGPDDNLVTRRLIGRIPLKIGRDKVTVDGCSFPAADAMVRMVCPHPLNPERYVLVLAATSPAGMTMAGGPDDVDFAVIDGRVPNGEEGRPAQKVWPATGVFDYNWRLKPEFVTTGDPETRAKSPLRKAPRLLSAKVQGDDLMLSDLLPSQAQGTFGMMMRDLNWAGKPITLGGKSYPRGIAVNTSDGPNAAEWDLAGAGWRRLRGVIGIEVWPEPRATPLNKDNTRTIFVVRGDGKELYRSEPFTYDSAPKELDVDVTGVSILRLEVVLGAAPWDAVASADWAELRLER